MKNIVWYSVILCIFASAAFAQPGRGFGRGHDERHAADREVFHFLLSNHKDIQRTVKELPDGVETLTESEEVEIAAKIKEHVRWMEHRIANARPIRMRDPLFRELFHHADKIQMERHETQRGVRVIERSDDAYVAKLIKEHAKAVSGFVELGFAEAQKNHVVPKRTSDLPVSVPPMPLPKQSSDLKNSKENQMNFIMEPWPWWLSGILIGLTVPLLYLLAGKGFGISTSLQQIGAMCAPNSRLGYLRNYDRTAGLWTLVFVVGITFGAFLGSRFLSSSPIEFVPESFHSWPGAARTLIGGFLVGFGARYAGGCTSGHAITGISNFNWPSLVATVCFFAGGLTVTWGLGQFIF